MTPDVTPDQMLRAIDYISAVWTGDDYTMERLDSHVLGQLPTRHLLVDFMEVVLTSAAVVQAAADDAPPAERQDYALALSGVLVRTLDEWARSAQPDDSDDTDDVIPTYTKASEGMARAIATYFLAVADGPPGDLEARLTAYRAGIAMTSGKS